MGLCDLWISLKHNKFVAITKLCSCCNSVDECFVCKCTTFEYITMCYGCEETCFLYSFVYFRAEGCCWLLLCILIFFLRFTVKRWGNKYKKQPAKPNNKKNIWWNFFSLSLSLVPYTVCVMFVCIFNLVFVFDFPSLNNVLQIVSFVMSDTFGARPPISNSNHTVCIFIVWFRLRSAPISCHVLVCRIW